MYHYTESGLKNVWLRNGYAERETPYGKTVAIEDLLGLHRAIASTLVVKSGKLTGTEIRFLRKEMEMSQSTLGSLLGVSAQTLALWEKGRAKITVPAERLLRLTVKGHFNGNARIRQAIEMLNQLDALANDGKLVFEEQQKKWKSAA